MSTVTEIDLAIQQVDSLLSQLQVNSKARPSAQEPKSVPSKGASRPRASFEVDYCAGRLQLCALQTPNCREESCWCSKYTAKGHWLCCWRSTWLATCNQRTFRQGTIAGVQPICSQQPANSVTGLSSHCKQPSAERRRQHVYSQ